MEHSWILILAMIGHVLCVYADRLLLCTPGGQFSFSDMKDNARMAKRFEAKLEQFSGNMERAAVELAQEWRADKAMRKLEAMLIAACGDSLLIISGTGEVITPDDGIAAVGSGGNYAMAAARALQENTDLSAKEIAEKALHIAADICVFTNHNVIVEEV